MGKYMGNVPRLLDINAKCTDIKFPDVRGIVDLVMLPEMEDPHSSFSSSATDGMRDESPAFLIPPPHTSASSASPGYMDEALLHPCHKTFSDST